MFPFISTFNSYNLSVFDVVRYSVEFLVIKKIPGFWSKKPGNSKQQQPHLKNILKQAEFTNVTSQYCELCYYPNTVVSIKTSNIFQ